MRQLQVLLSVGQENDKEQEVLINQLRQELQTTKVTTITSSSGWTGAVLTLMGVLVQN